MEQANDDCDELRLDFEECKRVTAEIEKSKGIKVYELKVEISIKKQDGIIPGQIGLKRT